MRVGVLEAILAFVLPVEVVSVVLIVEVKAFIIFIDAWSINRVINCRPFDPGLLLFSNFRPGLDPAFRVLFGVIYDMPFYIGYCS